MAAAKKKTFFLFVPLHEPKDKGALPRRGQVAVMRPDTTPPTDTEKKVFFILEIDLTETQEKTIREEIAAFFSRRLGIDRKAFFGLNAATRANIDKKSVIVHPVKATFEDLEANTAKEKSK